MGLQWSVTRYQGKHKEQDMKQFKSKVDECIFRGPGAQARRDHYDGLKQGNLTVTPELARKMIKLYRDGAMGTA
jgi:hypothetical protein